jgi:glycosyltransferase involved in cell wall biosynthesis
MSYTKDVSIILPVYNVADFLPACLESIRSQTLTNIEAIFVNDCSPDNSQEILERYASDDDRIVLLKQETNQGQGAARNAGFDASKGKYIYFLDPDDLFYDENSLRHLFELAETHDSDMVTGDVVAFEYDGDPFVDPQPMYFSDLFAEKKTNIRLKDLPELLKCNNVWNRLMRADYLRDKNIRYVPPRHAEDMLFALYSTYHADSITLTPQRTMRYRRGRYLKAATPRKCIDAAHNLKTQLDFIRSSNEPGLIRYMEQKVLDHVSSSYQREYHADMGPEMAIEFLMYYSRVIAGINVDTACPHEWKRSYLRDIRDGNFYDALRFLAAHDPARSIFSLSDNQKEAVVLAPCYASVLEKTEDKYELPPLNYRWKKKNSGIDVSDVALDNITANTTVCVVIDARNHVEGLDETLESIARQTVKRTTIMIEADDSEIHKKFASDEKISFIENDFTEANGDYIIRIKASETLSNQFSLQHVLLLADIHKAAVVLENDSPLKGETRGGSIQTGVALDNVILVKKNKIATLEGSMKRPLNACATAAPVRNRCVDKQHRSERD